MLIGYGMTILAAYVATHYEKIRKLVFCRRRGRRCCWRFIV